MPSLIATLKVKLPNLPNFVALDGVDGHIDVAKLDDSQLRALGEAWTDALIAHARKRRSEYRDSRPSA